MIREQIQNYYILTKPGIVYGNAISALAGFLFAAGTHIDFKVFIGMLLGVCLSIASACVFNNYIDRDIDRKMNRTKTRALVTGSVSTPSALIFATILGVIGFLLMVIYTNLITVFVGAIGFVDYVILYGYFKRTSVHGTVVGSISGSMPLVAGYTAATNRFDVGAVLLFLIMTFWQMPHFYAIALYRMNDYKNASLPVLPVVRGIKATKIQILLYCIGFLITSVLLTFFHYAGYIYLVIIGACGLYWVWLATKGFGDVEVNKWARKVFRFSLVILLIFCLVISLQGFFKLP